MTCKADRPQPKPKYTKKMIEACRRRIRQYEEMIETGVVTRWFQDYGDEPCTICVAVQNKCRRCVFPHSSHRVYTDCSARQATCYIVPCLNEDTYTRMDLLDWDKGRQLTAAENKVIVARLAYLKRLFKEEGVI